MESHPYTVSAVAALALIGLTACSSSDSAAGGYVADGALTICASNSEYPPMYWTEGSEFTGIEVALTTRIAEALDREPVYTKMAFDGIIPAVNSGRCDIAMGSFFLTPERLASLGGVPYLDANVALIYPAGNPSNFRAVEDLAGKKVAVQRGSVQESAISGLDDRLRADGLAGIDIQRYDDPTAQISAVRNRQADAAGETEVFATRFFSETERPDLAYTGNFFSTDSQIGFFFESEEVGAEVTRVMDELKSSGAAAAVVESFGMSPGSVAG